MTKQISTVRSGSVRSTASRALKIGSKGEHQLERVELTWDQLIRFRSFLWIRIQQNPSAYTSIKKTMKGSNETWDKVLEKYVKVSFLYPQLDGHVADCPAGSTAIEEYRAGHAQGVEYGDEEDGHDVG